MKLTVSSGATACVFEPREGNPILTRSYLEARWLQTVDCLQLPFKFEPERFFKPPSPRTGKVFQYLPDLLLPGQQTYAELKGDLYTANQLSLTDPYCLWQCRNEQAFEHARKMLADASIPSDSYGPQQFSADERPAYTEAWLIGGHPDSYSIVLFSEVPALRDCYDYVHGWRLKSDPAGGPLGICPNCHSLGIFRDLDLCRERSVNALPIVDCQFCGMKEAVQAGRVGKLQAFLDNEVYAPFIKAATFSGTASARIYKAYAANPEATVWRYRVGQTQKTIEVAPDLFTRRRV